MRPHGDRNVAAVVNASMTLKLKLNAQAIHPGCVLHQPYVRRSKQSSMQRVADIEAGIVGQRLIGLVNNINSALSKGDCR